MRFKVTDPGIDAISQDGVSYRPNDAREITVPDSVGHVLLRVGAGCVHIPDAPPPPPPPPPLLERMVLMIAPTDDATFAWRGKVYSAIDGIIEIPASAVTEAISFGFVVADIDEGVLALEYRKEG